MVVACMCIWKCLQEEEEETLLAKAINSPNITPTVSEYLLTKLIKSVQKLYWLCTNAITTYFIATLKTEEGDIQMSTFVS